MEAGMRLDKSARIYVAGHRGLVGSAICRLLVAHGFNNGITWLRDELDLREAGPVHKFFAEYQPEVVVLAAAKVGGIHANAIAPTEHLSENLHIQLNVLDTAHRF